MDESTNTLLYTATYVFIFIIAISLSIVLYLSVNRYADSAFEYKQSLNGSIINTAETGLESYESGQVPLTKEDAFSYYVNYVKKDLYGTNVNTNQNINYNVIVKDNENKEISSDLGYSQVYNSLADKYVLKYTSKSSNIVNIEITPKS